MTAELIRQHLWNILRQWDDMLEPTKTGGSEPVKGSKEAPLPISVGVLSLRRFACEQLGAWVHLIHEERELTSAHDLQDTKASARFITTHAEWLAAHVAGPDALSEIAAIDQRVTSLVTGNRARKFTVGVCPEFGTSDLGERVPCEGELFALIRNTDSLLPSELRCTLDPLHAWSAAEWRTLGDRIHGGPQARVSVVSVEVAS